MKTSNNGITLIKRFEGCRLTAYKDAVGVLTIGYGHTGDVSTGQVITQVQAEQILKDDLAKFEAKVNKYNSKYDWNQNEFDALVCFALNIGNIDQLTAMGTRDRETIASKILEYNKAGGKVLTGLTTRRKAEREIFLTEETTTERLDMAAYTKGTYKLTCDLKVRSGAGTNFKQKSYSQLTTNAMVHATKEGVLKSGTKVDVCEVIQNVDDIWGRIPSGYIALFYNGESLAVKC